MKSKKNLLSFLLAMVMLFTTFTPAFAANEGRVESSSKSEKSDKNQEDEIPVEYEDIEGKAYATFSLDSLEDLGRKSILNIGPKAIGDVLDSDVYEKFWRVGIVWDVFDSYFPKGTQIELQFEDKTKDRTDPERYITVAKSDVILQENHTTNDEFLYELKQTVDDNKLNEYNQKTKDGSKKYKWKIRYPLTMTDGVSLKQSGKGGMRLTIFQAAMPLYSVNWNVLVEKGNRPDFKAKWYDEKNVGTEIELTDIESNDNEIKNNEKKFYSVWKSETEFNYITDSEGVFYRVNVQGFGNGTKANSLISNNSGISYNRIAIVDFNGNPLGTADEKVVKKEFEGVNGKNYKYTVEGDHRTPFGITIAQGLNVTFNPNTGKFADSEEGLMDEGSIKVKKVNAWHSEAYEKLKNRPGIPTRLGYKFIGWSTKQIGVDDSVSIDAFEKASELVATSKRVKMDGSEIDPEKDKDIKLKDTKLLTKYPENYKDSIYKLGDKTIIIEDNMTFYAVYKPIPKEMVKITVEVEGDGAELKNNDANTFDVEKGSLWSDKIKTDAEGLLNVNPDYKIAEWRIGGQKIEDTHEFNAATTITAIVKPISVDSVPKGDEDFYTEIIFTNGMEGKKNGKLQVEGTDKTEKIVFNVLKVASKTEVNNKITEKVEKIKIVADAGYDPSTEKWSPKFTEFKGEDLVGELSLKQRTFNAQYTEKDKITITYKATLGGSVNPPNEKVTEAGDAKGSTATAKPGYEFVKFVNWTNEAGEEVSTKAKFVPAKVKGLNVAATYTAHFQGYRPIEIKPGATEKRSPIVSVEKGTTVKIEDRYNVPHGWKIVVDKNTGVVTVNAPEDAQIGKTIKVPVVFTDKTGKETKVELRIKVISPLPDVIVDPKDPTPKGYVRVTFDPTRDGILSTKAKYGEMQVYDVKATLTWGEAVEKGMEVPKATHAYYDFIFDGWAPRLQDDRELVKAETYVAQYYDMSNYYHREEKVEKRYDLHREMHYVQGTGKGLFSPNKGMTRAEAATILANVLRNEGFIKTLRVLPYSDVDRNAWYYDSALIVTQANVFKGTDKGMFEGERLITRAEWIATLARFQRIRAIYGNNLGVKDGHWAMNEVEGAFQQGWLALYRRGTDFDMAIPRQEAVYIANRAFGKVIDRDFVNKNLDKMISFPDVNKANEFFYDIIAASNTYFTSKDRGEWLNSLTRKGDFILKMGNYQITQTLYRR